MVGARSLIHAAPACFTKSMHATMVAFTLGCVSIAYCG
jgi:hypothetical protein